MVFYSGVMATEENEPTENELQEDHMSQMIEEFKKPTGTSKGIPQININKKTPKKLPQIDPESAKLRDIPSTTDTMGKSYL